MKPTTLALCCLAAALWGGSLHAAVIATDPTGGDLTGAPGATVGWGFTIQNDSGFEWISFTQSALVNETNPSVGIYADFIGPQGGPVNFVLNPSAPWSQLFSQALQTGLGAFAIDPAALPGSANSGVIRIFYDSFTEDPGVCSGCQPTPFSVDVPFSVTVTETPEPEAAALALAGLALLLAGRVIRRR